jgi:DNA-binding MarR family transcriptional regulator
VTLDAAIEAIQLSYPQVYYACHTRHGRARSDASRLSQRDAQILVHLDRRDPMTLTGLAEHMDLAASTLSEAVANLVGLGYVERVTSAADRRRAGLVLTAKGVAAVRASSVLESARLRQVLKRLTVRERAGVATALARLARACRPSIAAKGRKERRHRA